jgi:hypothetical protein
MSDASSQFEALFSAAEATLRQRDAKDLSILRSLANGLRESDGFAAAFEAGLCRLRNDPGYVPRDCTPGLWKMHEDSGIVATWLVEPRPRPGALLVGLADAIYLPAHVPCALRVRTYSTDRPIRVDVFEPEVRLQVLDERPLGEAFLARPEPGQGAAWEFFGDAPVAVLRIARRDRAPFLWDFDPTTLAPRLLFPSDILAARQRLMLEFLQASGHGDVEWWAEQMLQSEEYFLRWAAMQAIVQRDPVRMREMLELGCGDRHPEIRATSQRVLQQSLGQASP